MVMYLQSESLIVVIEQLKNYRFNMMLLNDRLKKGLEDGKIFEFYPWVCISTISNTNL